MTYCSHCGTDSATVRLQAERIAILEEKLIQANEGMRGSLEKVSREGFSGSEHAMLTLLLTSETVSRRSLLACLPSQKGGPAVVTQFIYRLRRKLAPLGLSIINVHGHGFYIPREDRKRGMAELGTDAEAA